MFLFNKKTFISIQSKKYLYSIKYICIQSKILVFNEKYFHSILFFYVQFYLTENISD